MCVGRYNLGVLHLVGIGVPQAFNTAADLFQQSIVSICSPFNVLYFVVLTNSRLQASGSNYLAMIRLGQMHFRGTGFRKSCHTAINYFKPAVEHAVLGASMEEVWHCWPDLP